MEQPVLILGMHRSGTSYLASLLQSLGVFIGDDLIGAQLGNPRGHFEERCLLEFHQKALAARIGDAGRAFDDGMMHGQPFDFEPTPAEATEAAAILDRLRRPGPWGWKEPRTALFAEFWFGLLPSAKAVLVYRHPLEVHDSMLRRRHWDQVLFPAQVLQAYTNYNRTLLACRARRPGSFQVLNANAAFAQRPALVASLCAFLGLTAPEAVRDFHPEEFRTLAISPAMHALCGLILPEATEAFESLQNQSTFPRTLVPHPDDARIAALHAALLPLLSPLPPAERLAFLPLLESFGMGLPPAECAARRAAQAEAIGEKVRAMDAWHANAARAFEENKRLFAEKESLGREFAAQQEFLQKQSTDFGRIWEELKRVGQGWEQQHAYIQSQEKLIAELRAKLTPGT